MFVQRVQDNGLSLVFVEPIYSQLCEREVKVVTVCFTLEINRAFAVLL